MKTHATCLVAERNVALGRFNWHALVQTAALVLMTNLATAQTLPGPATQGGFFVVMGPPTNSHGQPVRGATGCFATVIAQGEPILLPMAESKRFGPYPTREVARNALITAGWDCDGSRVGLICWANGGC
jgi:hypothetical protein